MRFLARFVLPLSFAALTLTTIARADVPPPDGDRGRRECVDVECSADEVERQRGEYVSKRVAEEEAKNADYDAGPDAGLDLGFYPHCQRCQQEDDSGGCSTAAGGGDDLLGLFSIVATVVGAAAIVRKRRP